MKACTNEKCWAYGKDIHPDHTKCCPICGQSIAKYGYQFVLDFLTKANIDYTDTGDRYNFTIAENTVSFQLLKRDTNMVILAISTGVECEDGSLSNEKFLRVCNEVNIECPFAKIRYISDDAVLVSSCTFFLDANVPTELIGEMLKDTHEAMSMFLRKMS